MIMPKTNKQTNKQKQKTKQKNKKPGPYNCFSLLKDDDHTQHMAEQCIMSFLVAAFVNVGGVINKQNKQNSVLLFCYNNNNKRHKKTIKAA